MLRTNSTPSTFENKSSPPTVGQDVAVKVNKSPGRYHRLLPDKDDIIRVCSEKLLEHMNHNLALKTRAVAYIKKGELDLALQDLSRLLELDPNSKDALYHRGIVNIKNNSYQEAISDFSTVLQLDPMHSRALFQRATCWNLLGLYQLAIEDCSHALELDKSEARSSPSFTPVAAGLSPTGGAAADDSSVCSPLGTGSSLGDAEGLPPESAADASPGTSSPSGRRKRPGTWKQTGDKAPAAAPLSSTFSVGIYTATKAAARTWATLATPAPADDGGSGGPGQDWLPSPAPMGPAVANEALQPGLKQISKLLLASQSRGLLPGDFDGAAFIRDLSMGTGQEVGLSTGGSGGGRTPAFVSPRSNPTAGARQGKSGGLEALGSALACDTARAEGASSPVILKVHRGGSTGIGNGNGNSCGNGDRLAPVGSAGPLGDVKPRLLFPEEGEELPHGRLRKGNGRTRGDGYGSGKGRGAVDRVVAALTAEQSYATEAGAHSSRKLVSSSSLRLPTLSPCCDTSFPLTDAHKSLWLPRSASVDRVLWPRARPGSTLSITSPGPHTLGSHVVITAGTTTETAATAMTTTMAAVPTTTAGNPHHQRHGQPNQSDGSGTNKPRRGSTCERPSSIARIRGHVHDGRGRSKCFSPNIHTYHHPVSPPYDEYMHSMSVYRPKKPALTSTLLSVFERQAAVSSQLGSSLPPHGAAWGTADVVKWLDQPSIDSSEPGAGEDRKEVDGEGEGEGRLPMDTANSGQWDNVVPKSLEDERGRPSPKTSRPRMPQMSFALGLDAGSASTWGPLSEDPESIEDSGFRSVVHPTGAGAGAEAVEPHTTTTVTACIEGMGAVKSSAPAESREEREKTRSDPLGGFHGKAGTVVPLPEPLAREERSVERSGRHLSREWSRQRGEASGLAPAEGESERYPYFDGKTIIDLHPPVASSRIEEASRHGYVDTLEGAVGGALPLGSLGPGRLTEELSHAFAIMAMESASNLPSSPLLPPIKPSLPGGHVAESAPLPLLRFVDNVFSAPHAARSDVSSSTSSSRTGSSTRTPSPRTASASSDPSSSSTWQSRQNESPALLLPTTTAGARWAVPSQSFGAPTAKSQDAPSRKATARPPPVCTRNSTEQGELAGVQCSAAFAAGSATALPKLLEHEHLGELLNGPVELVLVEGQACHLHRSTSDVAGPGSQSVVPSIISDLDGFRDSGGTKDEEEFERLNAFAFALRRRGAFEAALQAYDSAVRLRSSHFKTLFNRAFTYDKIGDYAAAVRDYTAALAARPHSVYALYNCGIAKNRLGEFHGAAQDFSAAIHYADVIILQRYAEGVGATAAAAMAMEMATRSPNGNLPTSFGDNRTDTLASSLAPPPPSNAIGALESLSAAIREPLLRLSRALGSRRPTDQAAADGLEKEGKGAKAPPFVEEHKTRVVPVGMARMAPDGEETLSIPAMLKSAREMGVADFYHNRGFSLRKQNLLEEAVRDYSSAILLDPDHRRAYFNRALCRTLLGLQWEAVRDYSEAIRLDVGNAAAYQNRAALLDALGRPDMARRDFATAAALNSGSALFPPSSPLSVQTKHASSLFFFDVPSPTTVPAAAHTYELAATASARLTGQARDLLSSEDVAGRRNLSIPESAVEVQSTAEALLLPPTPEQQGPSALPPSRRPGPLETPLPKLDSQQTDKLSLPLLPASQRHPSLASSPRPPRGLDVPSAEPFILAVDKHAAAGGAPTTALGNGYRGGSTDLRGEGEAMPFTAFIDDDASPHTKKQNGGGDGGDLSSFAIEQRLNQLKERAAAHRVARDFKAAVLVLSEALALNPGDATVLSQRAHAYRKMGEYDAATDDYTIALDVILRQKNNVLAGQDGGARGAEDGGESPSQVVDGGRDALLVKLYTSRGYCLARLRRLGEAVADYDHVLRLEPGNRHAKHNRQVTLDRLLSVLSEALRGQEY